jgi:S-adenosylmethionine hydrolase
VGPEDVDDLGERVTLRYGDAQVRTARRAAAYAELKTGEVGLVVDSYGMVSVALDRRPAADELGLRPGAAVTLEAPS